MNRRLSLQRMKIRTKLLLGLFAVILCLGLILGVIGARIASTELIQENKERGKALASNLAYKSEEPLLARDYLRLKDLVDEMLQANPDLAYAFILDPSGRVLVHTFERGFPVQLLDLREDARARDRAGSRRGDRCRDR